MRCHRIGQCYDLLELDHERRGSWQLIGDVLGTVLDDFFSLHFGGLMETLRRVVWLWAGRGLASGLLVLASPLALTADLTIPNTFVQGQPAVANEVNQNFSATAGAVNSKQDRVSAACPVGQAIRSIAANGTVTCETTLDSRLAGMEALLNYMPVGPQVNVPQARVNLGGWTTCYTDLYNAATGVIANILATCNKANLMLACLPTGTDTYTVLAQAPRTDVGFTTPADAVTVHVANGTAWYFNTSLSWGFAKAGDAVNKNSCDTAVATDPGQRMCWHTSAGNVVSGHRCGATEFINNNTFQRVVLHRD
jgi:hypothetical protein